jgi:hypothetical protein
MATPYTRHELRAAARMQDTRWLEWAVSEENRKNNPGWNVAGARTNSGARCIAIMRAELKRREK